MFDDVGSVVEQCLFLECINRKMIFLGGENYE